MIKLILFLLLSSVVTMALALEQKDIQPFEDKILEEARPYLGRNPLKDYELMVLIGREYNAYGFEAKALEFYEKALKHPVKVDRTEPLISTVALALQHKALALKNMKRLKESAEGKKPELKEWIATVESYLHGKTVLPENAQSPYYIWAQDNKIEELIKEKKFEEAFRLIGPVKLEDLNINTKIRYDLLSSAVLKKVPPKLWCEDVLKEYPTSLTWSMRICRYLIEKRDKTKSTESIGTIQAQLAKESPERASWLSLLEML